jgi:hypothetical protein
VNGLPDGGSGFFAGLAAAGAGFASAFFSPSMLAHPLRNARESTDATTTRRFIFFSDLLIADKGMKSGGSPCVRVTSRRTFPTLVIYPNARNLRLL